MDEPPAPDAPEPTHAQTADAPSPPALDPAIFQYLLSRVEHLSRELGRAEGKQIAFERQVARLEQQLARLEREREA